LGGSYDEKDALFLGRLDTLAFEQILPVDEAGQRLREFRSFGRRHRLYLATTEALHVVELRSL
jgi:hypothetical protein